MYAKNVSELDNTVGRLIRIIVIVIITSTVNVLIFAGTNFRVSMKLNNIRGTNFHGFTSVK